MKPLISILTFLLVSFRLNAQTDNLFWFAAPDVSSVHGEVPRNGTPINLHVTAVLPTTVTISQPANPDFTPVTFSLGELEHRSIRLDQLLDISQIENYPQSLPLSPSTAQNKAFKIESFPSDITAYYELDNNYNREIFTLKGRNALGKEFYVSTQNAFDNGDYSGTAWSGFVIAATEANTTIQVYPKNDWLFFDTNPGDVITLTLNAGETFAFRGLSTIANNHINGAKVESDKDITITWYDDSIKKKNTDNATCTSGLSYDICGDQSVPLSLVGSSYLVVKGNITDAVSCDRGERIFITSTQANTHIFIDGILVATMANAGEIYNYLVNNSVLHVVASKPIVVNHLTGFGAEMGGAVLPAIDNGSGSYNVSFTRSPNSNDGFQLNLMAANDTTSGSLHKNKAAGKFTIFSHLGANPIPEDYFDYLPDSSWVILKKNAEVISFLADKIVPGQEVRISNAVAHFHLGVVSGGSTTGCKYGYLSDYSLANNQPDIVSQDSLMVTIASAIFYEEWYLDEPLHLRITDTVTQDIWYDEISFVTKAYGFKDTIYLDSGTYKCEILDIGANVSTPVITVDGNRVIPWGYPEYEYFLFTLPGTYNTNATIWRTACDSMVSPSTRYIWFNNGTFTDTIPNSAGFDSVITVNLTILNSTSSLLNETACFNYVSPNGQLLETSGIFHQTIPNARGCDSMITINLTIVNIDNTITQTDGLLTSNQNGAEYQWIVCNSGLDIDGATEQSYTPLVSGLYAVSIAKDECVSTSSCYEVMVTSENENHLKNAVSYYPNPVINELTIQLNKTYRHIGIKIEDLYGKNVLTGNYNDQNTIQVNLEKLNQGIYFIQLSADRENTSFKITKY